LNLDLSEQVYKMFIKNNLLLLGFLLAPRASLQ
jgi:hypothetical protein